MPKFTVQISRQCYYEVTLEAVDHWDVEQKALCLDTTQMELLSPESEEWKMVQAVEQVESAALNFFIEQINTQIEAVQGRNTRGADTWMFRATRVGKVICKMRYENRTFEQAKSNFLEQLQDQIEEETKYVTEHTE